MPGLKRQRIAIKRNEKQCLKPKPSSFSNDHKHTYGYRRLSNELGKAGIKSGHYRVRHLMVRLGLKARYPKRFKVTTDSNHNEAISPNSLDRQFEAKAPNQVWTTDITYIWTLEGWLYLAVVIDLFSRQVVAFWRRKPKPGLLHHSDRGSQYASHEYRKHLSIMKMEQSMSRKGNCWDNSPTERFFRRLKHEQLNYEKLGLKHQPN